MTGACGGLRCMHRTASGRAASRSAHRNPSTVTLTRALALLTDVNHRDAHNTCTHTHCCFSHALFIFFLLFFSLRTPLCLQFAPSVICVAAIRLAMRHLITMSKQLEQEPTRKWMPGQQPPHGKQKMWHEELFGIDKPTMKCQTHINTSRAQADKLPAFVISPVTHLCCCRCVCRHLERDHACAGVAEGSEVGSAHLGGSSQIQAEKYGATAVRTIHSATHGQHRQATRTEAATAAADAIWTATWTCARAIAASGGCGCGYGYCGIVCSSCLFHLFSS